MFGFLDGFGLGPILLDAPWQSRAQSPRASWAVGCRREASLGNHPLTKKPEDSGYESGALVERESDWEENCTRRINLPANRKTVFPLISTGPSNYVFYAHFKMATD